MNTTTLNQSITSKYSHVIQEVRNLVAEGWDHGEAVILAIDDAQDEFENPEDKATLLTWLDGSFGKNVA